LKWRDDSRREITTGKTTMSDFEKYWATTGPWPYNIMGTAFRELAEQAFNAGMAVRPSLGPLKICACPGCTVLMSDLPLVPRFCPNHNEMNP
jgi:hypothetical protein